MKSAKLHTTILRQIPVLLLLTIPPALLSAFFHPRAPLWQENLLKPGEIHSETAFQWKNTLWVDARSRTEFEKEHYPDAILLNEEEWDHLIPNFFDRFMDDPDRKIIVYCDGTLCARSTQVAERLRADIGEAQIFVLKGDWRKWNN